MRSGVLGLLAVLVVGLGLLIWRGSLGEEIDVTRIGVPAAGPISTLTPNEELCQRPLDIDHAARIVGVAIYNGPNPGPPVRIRVSDADTGRPLASATVPAGWTLDPGSYFGLTMPRALPADHGLEVCARNDGKRTIELYGKESLSASNLYRGDDNIGGDWAIYFPLEPGTGRNYLEMIPDFLRRASVLRPGFVGPATYVVLALLLLVGGPLLLWRAISRAEQED